MYKSKFGLPTTSSRSRFVTIDVITAAMIAFVIRTITTVLSIVTHGIITNGAITIFYDMPTPNHHEYKRE